MANTFDFHLKRTCTVHTSSMNSSSRGMSLYDYASKKVLAQVR